MQRKLKYDKPQPKGGLWLSVTFLLVKRPGNKDALKRAKLFSFEAKAL